MEFEKSNSLIKSVLKHKDHSYKQNKYSALAICSSIFISQLRFPST